MISRFLSFVILLPLAIVLIVLCVANRQPVTLSLDPIGTLPQLGVEAPLFVFLFGAVILGLVLGGLGTWLTQSTYRRKSAQRKQDAERWRREAEANRERLRQLQESQERQNAVPAGPALAPPRAAAALAGPRLA